MKKPLVSIRIVTYNHENFIAETIQSCLNQTYENIEICISDDCSTDNTVSIIKEYIKKYPDKIKLYIQPMNMGIYSLAINGNTGRTMATGEYIAILDGDERMHPQRVEKQLYFLENNKTFIAVSHKKLYINVNGLEQKTQLKDHKLTVITTKDLILQGNLFKNCYLYKNINILSDISLKVMADWESIIRLSMQGQLGYMQEILTYKIIHEESVTATRVKQFEEDKLISLALLEYKYPSLIKYINIARTHYYISKYKNTRNKEYLWSFFNMGLKYQYFTLKQYLEKKVI